MGAVEGCDVSGGSEGIVTHASNIMVSGNRVHGTSLRGDHDERDVDGRDRRRTTSPAPSGSGSTAATTRVRDQAERRRRHALRPHGQRGARPAIGIEANYYAEAELDDNVLVGNPRPVALFAQSRIVSDEE